MIKQIRNLVRSVKRSLKPDPDRFLSDVSGVVHVGANTGQERDQYQASDLEVLWIEPIPTVFSELSANISGIENQSAIRALVTDTDDKMYEFYVANNEGASSSIFDLKEAKDIWPSLDYTRTIHVKGATLPTLFERKRIDPRRYDALIMDTQGSELMVLEGSVPILEHFTYIKTEVADFEPYDGCCQLSDMQEFMSHHGYRQFSRNRVARRPQGGNYFEIVYKKAELC